MARRFGTNLDLQRNELQNAKIQNLASDPATPTAGQIYYNTGSLTLKFYNGTAFQDIGVTLTPAASVVASTAFGQASAVGTSLNYARQDHVHGTPAAPTAASVGAVANLGGAPGVQSGLAASRPTSGLTVGQIYNDTDDGLQWIANSTTTFQQLQAFGGSAPAAVGSAAATVGTATTYIRSDHVHGVTTAAPTASAVGDASVTGTAITVSLSDHKHAREAFGAVTAQTAYSAASGNGAAATVARSDHTHGTPALPTAAQTGAVANLGGAPGAQSGLASARPTSGLTVGQIYNETDTGLQWVATSATTWAQLQAFAAAGNITAVTIATAAAAGTSNLYARGDHVHSVGTPGAATNSAVADAASAGASATPARADHVHGREAFGAVTAATSFGIAAANGAATTIARSDHTHGTPVAPTPGSVGAVANNGSAPGLQTGAAAGRPSSGQTVGNIYVDNDDFLLFIATGATTFAQLAAFGGAGTTINATASAAGTATTYSRSDHNHSITTGVASTSAVGDTATAGSGTAMALANHVHGREGFGAVTAQTTFGAASSNGVATTQARADHTHGTPVHDNAAHSAISISALANPTADRAWGGFKITGLADPVAAQDAATKNYVDNAVAGLAWKDAVRVASTANIAVASALINGAVIDGVTVATGDRVLLKNQTATAENGIWVVVAAGAASRATDADTGPELQGATAYIQEGTANGGQVYTLTTPGALTVGTTGLTFTQFSGASVATAGAGLTATGNVFAVGAGTGITVAADSVAVDTAVVVRKYAQAFGDGVATSFTITHSLGTQDVTVAVYTNSGVFDEIDCDIQHTSTTAVTLLFTVAPTTNQYRVVVHG